MGAHALSSLVRPSTPSSLLVILSVLVVYTGTPVAGLTEAESLLKFKSSLSHKEAISNWNPSRTPCSSGNTSNWLGVICQGGKVWGLQLENMGLGGNIDMDALSQLPELRTISLKNNKFVGSFPNLHRLPKLRSIYLSLNQFSGDIPDDAFAGMVALRRVVLTNNGFTGKIPSTLTALPILVEVKLNGNHFQGSIPNFPQKPLPSINMANNQLEGPIPSTLKSLDPNAFSGNKGLCGLPLEPCAGGNAASSSQDSKHISSSSSAMIVLPLLLGLATLVFIIVFLFVSLKEQKVKQGSLAPHDKIQIKEIHVVPNKKQTNIQKPPAEQAKLNFVRDDRKAFDLSDLLTASAEVLESSNFMSAS